MNRILDTSARVYASRGFTLLEVTIASIVLTTMSAMIVQSIRQLSVAEWSMREKSKIASLTERVIASMESDIAVAVKTFDDDEVGREFLKRFAHTQILESGTAILEECRLPVRTVYGTFGPDPADIRETGNVLALAVKDGHETVTFAGAGPATSGRRRIDCLRFVVWFLHDGPETGVDLARWSSARVARFADVHSIQDAASRALAIQDLRSRGVLMSWNPQVDAPDGFAHLEEDGSITPFGTNDTVSTDAVGSESGIGARRFVGIAANGHRSPPVPFFGVQTAGFPHGFEVKRDGDGAADLVFVRLVFSSKTGANRDVVSTGLSRQVSFRAE